MNFYDRYWSKASFLSNLLWPLSRLFAILLWVRRQLYRVGLKASKTLPVPVIVVGNITVGGTGKTPLVIALVKLLRAAGYQPGVISRGYGGSHSGTPILVTPSSFPQEVGDEPLLIARSAACPVVVCADRLEAGRQLLSTHGVDVIVSDDGLQHYRLARDIEICVVDGERQFGNGRLLPAGPLREPLSRLNQVTFIVQNGGEANEGWYSMALKPTLLSRIQDPEVRIPADSFSGRQVHGVAGIGNPNRFFATLRSLGMQLVPHPFPDHHQFVAKEIQFFDKAPVVMTEKDAVKCVGLTDSNHWQLQVEAVLADPFNQTLLDKLKMSN